MPGDIPVPEAAVIAATAACPASFLRRMDDGYSSVIARSNEEAARVALEAGAPHIVAAAFRRAADMAEANTAFMIAHVLRGWAAEIDPPSVVVS